MKLFDDHVQVYVDNDPVPVIDLYDYSEYTANTVSVTNGSDLVVAPETYALVDENAVTEFKLTKATLQLENDITVVFKAPVELEAVYSDCYIEVVQQLENEETETHTIPGVKSADGTMYEFKYTGVNAKEVGDLLDATIYGYDAEGNLVQGETLADYSVKQYCDSQLSKTSEELTAQGMSEAKQSAFRTLLVDMLNYATEAQVYFNYKADTLVNADLTDELKVYASSDNVLADLQNVTNIKHVEIENPSATWKAATLQLLSKTTVRVKFAYSGDISQVVMKVRVNEGEVVEVAELEDNGDGTYYAYFDGLTAAQFGSSIDFTLEASGVAISNTLRYSVESYVAKNVKNAATGDVVAAIMKYGKASAAFVAAE